MHLNGFTTETKLPLNHAVPAGLEPNISKTAGERWFYLHCHGADSVSPDS